MTALALTFLSVSNIFSLPAGLLSSLCFVESEHKTHKVNVNDGGSDSIGVCQIKLSTAQFLGFTGKAEELKTNPRLNIYYAGAYLKFQLNRYDGDVKKAVASYNSGSYKAKNGTAINKKYVNKVYSAWGAYDKN